MKHFACAAVLLALFATNAPAIQIDMSNGFAEITGPTTMRVSNVSVYGNDYWTDLEWNPTGKVFAARDVGPVGGTSLVVGWP